MIFIKFIKIIISIQTIIISTMIPAFITIPYKFRMIEILEIPITWQLPLVIILTLIFRGEVVYKAFTIYIIIGLFFIPVFHHGGSLGYLLTPNFGFLLGIYPLINIINNLYINNKKITVFDFIKSGIVGISFMHLIGIIYCCILYLYFKQNNLLFYNIGNYSLGRYPFQLLMLTPISLLIGHINRIKKQEIW